MAVTRPAAHEEVADRLATGGAREARRVVCDLVRHTPVLTSRSFSEGCGGRILLKAENLQRTGSFKLRGALHKVSLLNVAETPGVVAGSAGNHAQSLAYAARARGVPCEVFMPEGAAIGKVDAVEAFGGRVHLGGDSVDACVERARERAAATGAAFVSPFDDPQVILGQATLGLELLEDVPDLRKVVVPVGGGGLISGIAGAIKAERPEVEVVGVQVQPYATFAASADAGRRIEAVPSPTIADGIAIKRPGAITLPLVQASVDAWCTVTDDEVADAIALLLERSKLVVEGGGAVGLAALRSGRVRPAGDGATVVVLSGGNIDAGLLASVLRRHESTQGRRLRLFTRVADRPGGLARLLALVAASGANLVGIEHVREGIDLHVRETGVELTLETRGAAHAREIRAMLEQEGYELG